MDFKTTTDEPDFAAEENQQSADSGPPQIDGAQERTIETLIAEADELLTSQLDPAVREDLKAHPEKLAEWDALMQDYAQAVEEDRKEAEERRLTEEIGERVDQISADIDRLMELDPLDLDVDAALARNFAAMHELDAVMRERCRDYPAQLARWEEEVMGHLKELEAICAAAWEAEKAQPEN